MNEHDARLFAKKWAEVLLSPQGLIKTEAPSAKVTLSDVIRFSGMLLHGIKAEFRDQLLREKTQSHIGAVLEFVDNPEGLENYLFALTMEKGDEAGDIQEATRQMEALIATPRAKHGLLKNVLEDMFQKPPKGRPTEFDPVVDAIQFMELSTSLLRVCDSFLKLRRQFPKKQLADLLSFLEAEDPTGVALLRKHEGYLYDLIKELAAQHLKKHETKVQKFTDALAGKELFNWSCSYSLQRAAEFRRCQRKQKSE